MKNVFIKSGSGIGGNTDYSCKDYSFSEKEWNREAVKKTGIK
jgi:hypothetical protein